MSQKYHNFRTRPTLRTTSFPRHAIIQPIGFMLLPEQVSYLHSQRIRNGMQSPQRRIFLPVHKLAHSLWRYVHPLGQFHTTHVFFHITFSSCNCDSYFSFICLVVYVISHLHASKVHKTPGSVQETPHNVRYLASF